MGQGLGRSPELLLCADFTLKALHVRMPRYLCIFSCGTHQANVKNDVTSHRWLRLHVHHVSTNVFIHRRSAEKVIEVSCRNNFLTANQTGPICFMHNLFHFNFSLFHKCYIWLISTVMELYTVHPLRAYVTSEAEIFLSTGCLLLTRLLVVHICIFTLCLVHLLASLCISQSKKRKYPFLAEWMCHKLDHFSLVCYE